MTVYRNRSAVVCLCLCLCANEQVCDNKFTKQTHTQWQSVVWWQVETRDSGVEGECVQRRISLFTASSSPSSSLLSLFTLFLWHTHTRERNVAGYVDSRMRTNTKKTGREGRKKTNVSDDVWCVLLPVYLFTVCLSVFATRLETRDTRVTYTQCMMIDSMEFRSTQALFVSYCHLSFLLLTFHSSARCVSLFFHSISSIQQFVPLNP